MLPNDIPDNRRFDFCTKEPCLMRAKFIFKEYDNQGVFEEEIEKALLSERCTICGYPTYNNTDRCDEHKNAKLTEFWPDKDAVIPEGVYHTVERKIDNL